MNHLHIKIAVLSLLADQFMRELESFKAELDADAKPIQRERAFANRGPRTIVETPNAMNPYRPTEITKISLLVKQKKLKTSVIKQLANEMGRSPGAIRAKVYALRANPPKKAIKLTK